MNAVEQAIDMYADLIVRMQGGASVELRQLTVEDLERAEYAAYAAGATDIEAEIRGEINRQRRVFGRQ